MLSRPLVADERAVAALDRVATRAPAAYRRGLLKVGLLLGRRIGQNIDAFKQTAGTGRLKRSFIAPLVAPGSTSLVAELGLTSPIYARIHEYGGTIRAKRAPYLVFQTADGEWHTVKEVTIREKRYARDAIAALEASQEPSMVMGLELAREFRA